MSDFKITFSGIEGAMITQQKVERVLQDLKEEAKDVKSSLSFQVASRAQIEKRLTQFDRKIEEICEKEKSMISGLEAVSRKYFETELKLMRGSVSEFGVQLDNGTEGFDDGLKKWLWESAKKAGIVGSVIGIGDDMYNIVSGKDVSIGSVFSTIKSFKDTVWDIAEETRKMGKAKRILNPDAYKAAWKRKLIGTYSYFDDATGNMSKASKFGTRFYNNFQKCKVKEMAKVGWLDVAISGISNFLENKEEYESGEISGNRAVAETVTETAIDVGTTALMTAGAAAAIGATFGAAPVVAVGAAVVGGKMVLDTVAGWITGGEKDFVEMTSDFVIDTATAIGNGISEGIKNIGNGISTALNAIIPKWNFGFGF